MRLEELLVLEASSSGLAKLSLLGRLQEQAVYDVAYVSQCCRVEVARMDVLSKVIEVTSVEERIM